MHNLTFKAYNPLLCGTRLCAPCITSGWLVTWFPAGVSLAPTSCFACNPRLLRSTMDLLDMTQRNRIHLLELVLENATSPNIGITKLDEYSQEEYNIFVLIPGPHLSLRASHVRVGSVFDVVDWASLRFPSPYVLDALPVPRLGQLMGRFGRPFKHHASGFATPYCCCWNSTGSIVLFTA
ncbi:hypothetical protein OE88DRAFT_787569 [Heliocybe sulcata]|uniref:Uncharacterized protein n=1 Tax=Heliocybe sulcata TaxID=5364 RepID=A0A5C3N0L4_9AGAM|nr:hypothetical protein OE88DRAFT_787569 [Heliocybe sulcata]